MQTNTNPPDQQQAGQTTIAQQTSTTDTTKAQQQPNQPYEYNPTTNTSDNLNQLTNSDSLYMQQARQSGKNTAASRGLINSSIAAGAAEQAAISAAAPIAQADASTALQQWNMEKTVQANLQGAYADSINQMLNNAMINVSEIETAEGLEQSAKDKMIKNTIERRDADMAFLKTMYSAMPTWSNNWSSFPSMPDAPGVTLPDPEE